MFDKKFDIITFGSAAQDIFVKSGNFKIIEDGQPGQSGQAVCMPFGSKINVEEIFFTTGGGGTNTAATFARQGFKTAFCGAIGIDSAAIEIIRELKHLKVDTRFLVKKKEKHTNHSVIISNDGKERTILVYRGASDSLCDKDISWKKIKKTRWFYLAPFTGLLCLADAKKASGFAKIIDFASENNIKIAINPSKEQLSLPKEELARIFQKVDVLFLNQEEADFLTGGQNKDEIETIKKISSMCKGIVVVTKGGDGVLVYDKKNFYSALPDPSRTVLDATGAGDSFASGFLSDYIRTNGNIEKSIQLGMANSAGNLSQVGAKTGLLDKIAKFEPVKVNKFEKHEESKVLSK